jgi:hypothetical protein
MPRDYETTMELLERDRALDGEPVDSVTVDFGSADVVKVSVRWFDLHRGTTIFTFSERTGELLNQENEGAGRTQNAG